MAKREYHIEMPLTGMASGTVIAESEEEAIRIFAEECTIDDVDWGVDASYATATEGDEVEDEEEPLSEDEKDSLRIKEGD